MDDGPSELPRYNFPSCSELLLVLVLLAILTALGVAGAGSDVAQNLAHGNSAVYVDSARSR